MNQSQTHPHPRKLTSFKNNLNTPNRHTILNWINQLLPSYNFKTIQQLGNGQVYCRVINHYVPNTILDNRIVTHPRTEYQSCLNLKQFQLALVKLKINIPFDLRKVSKQNFNQNWALIGLLYKYMQTDFEKRQYEMSVAKVATSEIELASQKIISDQNCNKKIQQFTCTPKPSFINPNGDLWAVIDRTKQILLSNSHNTEKIRQIRKLYDLQEIKMEQDLQVLSPYIFHSK